MRLVSCAQAGLALSPGPVACPRVYWRLGRRTALRLGDWKLLRQARGRGEDRWELYDLRSDLGETTDLAAARGDKLAELREVWERLDREMIAPIWSPAPRRD